MKDRATAKSGKISIVTDKPITLLYIASVLELPSSIAVATCSRNGDPR